MTKTYVIATGSVFALLVLAHAARLFAEGLHPLSEPMFVGATLVGVGLCIWSIVVLRQLP